MLLPNKSRLARQLNHGGAEFMQPSLVVMGVSGCGKSTLAAAIAQAQGLPFLEGDDFHSPESRSKMKQGVPLTDDDRWSWLDRLGQELRAATGGLVLACSALKRAYRDRLRSADPNLRFVFMQVPQDEAQSRVAARATHFFSATLVDSQFATLEPPLDEADVLVLDATQEVSTLQVAVSTWLQRPA